MEMSIVDGLERAPLSASPRQSSWRFYFKFRESEREASISGLNFLFLVFWFFRFFFFFLWQPILNSQELITKGQEYSYLSQWLGSCMFLTTGNEGSSAQFTLIVNCSIDWRRKETAGGPADVFWRPLSTSRFLKASSTCSTSRASSSSTIWTQPFRTKLMDTSTSTRFWRRALWTSFAVGDHFITDFESCYWSFNFTQTLRWGDKFANGRKLAITCAASTGDFFFFFQFWHFLNVIYFYCGYYPAVVVATELGDGLESLRSWWNVRWDRGSISIACSTCRVSVKRTNGALKSCTISPIKSVRLFSISLSVSMNYQWIGPVQVIRDRKSALGDAEIALDRQTDSVDHEAPKSTS